MAEHAGPKPSANAVLNTALSRMPVEQREAIELAAGASMTYHQIAERTGVHGVTVQRRINRGLQALHVAMRVNAAIDDHDETTGTDRDA